MKKFEESKVKTEIVELYKDVFKKGVNNATFVVMQKNSLSQKLQDLKIYPLYPGKYFFQVTE